MQKMSKFGSNLLRLNFSCKDKASEKGENYKQTTINIAYNI